MRSATAAEQRGAVPAGTLLTASLTAGTTTTLAAARLGLTLRGLAAGALLTALPGLAALRGLAGTVAGALALAAAARTTTVAIATAAPGAGALGAGTGRGLDDEAAGHERPLTGGELDEHRVVGSDFIEICARKNAAFRHLCIVVTAAANPLGEGTGRRLRADSRLDASRLVMTLSPTVSPSPRCRS